MNTIKFNLSPPISPHGPFLMPQTLPWTRQTSPGKRSFSRQNLLTFWSLFWNLFLFDLGSFWGANLESFSAISAPKFGQV